MQFFGGVAAAFIAAILAALFMRRFRISAVRQVLRGWLEDLIRDFAVMQQGVSNQRTILQEAPTEPGYVRECMEKGLTPAFSWRGHVPDVEQYVFAHADLIGSLLVMKFVRLMSVIRRLKQTSGEAESWKSAMPSPTRVCRTARVFLWDLDNVETRARELHAMTRDWPAFADDDPRVGEGDLQAPAP
jgi:hypothetical protein